MSLARIRQIPKLAERPEYRIAIRPDEDGVDDVFVRDVSMFRMERMDTGAFWLCCYFADSDERITFWLNTKRGAFIAASVNEQPYGDAFPYEPGSMGA